MRLAHRATWIACALIPSIMQVQRARGGDAEVCTIAHSGMFAEGMDPNSTYVNFGDSKLNQNGFFAFQSDYSTGSFLNKGHEDVPTLSGIWTNAFGNVAPVIHGEMPLPGFPDAARFFTGSPLVMNRFGDLVISGIVRQKGNPQRDGLWVVREGSLQLIARQGDHAPGFDQATVFHSIRPSSSFPAITDEGKIALVAYVAASSSPQTVSNIGLWEENSGALRLLVRRDDPAPGFPPGYRIGDFHNPFVDGLGRIYFISSVVSSDGLTHTTTFWYVESGILHAIARAGQSFPGMAPGVVLSAFERVCVNSAGTVVVSGPLAGPGITSLTRDGVCYGQPGQMQLVLQSGQTAPGFPDGYRFLSIGGSNYVRALSDSGEIAFVASVSLPESPNLTERGVWQGVPGSLRLIARTNSTVPGVPGARFTFFFIPYVNAYGNIVFEAYISGGGASSGANNYEGFWGTDQSGQLKILVRNGDPIEIAPGDSRNLQSFSYFNNSNGGGDGRGIGFDSHGRLLLHLTFTDGSVGLFTATANSPR